MLLLYFLDGLVVIHLRDEIVADDLFTVLGVCNIAVFADGMLVLQIAADDLPGHHLHSRLDVRHGRAQQLMVKAFLPSFGLIHDCLSVDRGVLPVTRCI